jgi:hypothetical protein
MEMSTPSLPKSVGAADPGPSFVREILQLWNFLVTTTPSFPLAGELQSIPMGSKLMVSVPHFLLTSRITMNFSSSSDKG